MVAPDRDSVDALLEAYLEACSAGSAPDREAFLAEHPDQASVLRRRLDLLELCGDLQAASADRTSPDAVDPASTGDLPERFDGYRILRAIGRGGMGVVYEALDEELGRTVALKVLRADGAGIGARQVARFSREMTALARLRHPGIVSVFGSGVVGDRQYLVMEHVEGEPLDVWFEADGGAGSAEARRGLLDIGAQLAAALDHAHAQGIVHRDVKPSNVLVRADGAPVLLDFGLARADEVAASLTVTGEFVGTYLYASPEQVLGRPYDGRVDVYGLGATLFQLLVGSPPYPASSLSELVRRMQVAEPLDPRRVNRSLPRDVAAILGAATVRDAADRYASCAALGYDLRAVLDGRPVRARPPSVAGRVLRWSRRRPAVAALLVVAIVAALLAGLLYEQDRRRRAEQTRRETVALVDRTYAHAWNGIPAPGSDIQELLRRAPDSADAWLLAALQWYEPPLAPRIPLVTEIAESLGLDVHRPPSSSSTTAVRARLASAPADVLEDSAIALLLDVERYEDDEARRVRSCLDRLEGRALTAAERLRVALVSWRTTKRFDEAHDILIELVDGGDRSTSVLIGSSLMSFYDLESFAAVRAAAVADALSPGPLTSMQLARVLGRADRTPEERAEAERRAREVVADHPEMPLARHTLGWVLAEPLRQMKDEMKADDPRLRDRVDEVEQLYRDLIGELPDELTYRKNLSNLLIEHRRPAANREVLELLLERYPASAHEGNYNEWVTHILRELGEVDLARRWCEEALERVPPDERSGLRLELAELADAAPDTDGETQLIGSGENP